MLTVKDMGSTQANYYTELAREDYYTKGQEPPGVWLGAGAERLGLTGTIRESEFKNIYRGFSPDGETKLVQNAGKMSGKLSRDPGWDLTFSAPKSVSIVWAIADEGTRQRIEQAHFEAVRTIAGELERLTVVRKGKGGREREQAGLVVAAYRHSTSRAVDAHTLPDMQLHTHALILNVGVSPSDGKARTITSRQFYQNEKTLGAAYRAELARNLEAVGFEIVRARDSFDVKGVPQALITEFSKRTEQVRDQTKGLTEPEQKEKKKLAGRRVKDTYSRDELFTYWATKCRDFGFTSENVRELTGHATQERSVEHEKREAVKSAVAYLTANEPNFTRDQLQRAVMVEAQARGLGFREAMYATQDYLKYKAKYRGKEENKSLFTSPEKAEEQTAEKRREETRELKDFRHDLEEQGYKVLGLTFSRAGAREFEKRTGIKSGSVREAANALNRDDTQASANKRRAKREINIKYATYQIKRKTRRRIIKKINLKPTSEFVHNFKYATGQITQKHKNYLNAELRRSRFDVDGKTVVIVTASRKNLEGYSAARSLIADLESKGAKVYTTEEVMRARLSKEPQQSRRTELDQDLTQSLNYQR